MKYSKIDHEEIKREGSGLKKYLKLMKYEDLVMMFTLRAKICPTIKTHWKNDEEHRNVLWSCSSKCFSLDQISHVKVCYQYEDLRSDLDLEKPVNLVKYVRRVIDRRHKEKEEEEENKLKENE